MANSKLMSIPCRSGTESVPPQRIQPPYRPRQTGMLSAADGPHNSTHLLQSERKRQSHNAIIVRGMNERAIPAISPAAPTAHHPIGPFLLRTDVQSAAQASTTTQVNKITSA